MGVVKMKQRYVILLSIAVAFLSLLLHLYGGTQ